MWIRDSYIYSNASDAERDTTMSFLGKEYKFDREENFEDFLNSLGLPEEQVQNYINFKPTQSLVKDNDSYALINTTPSTKSEVNFKSGVTFNDKAANKKCKTTFTLEENVLTQVQNFEDGVVLTYKREFSEESLVVTITSSLWDGVARRYYKA